MAEVTFDARHNGSFATVRQGDSIMVSLPEKTAAGYQWVMEKPAPDILQLQQQDYSPDREIKFGGEGIRHFAFVAAGTGSALLSLKLLRPWLGDASIIARYQLSLTIL